MLERVLSAPPKHVRFIASDFNQRHLDSAMAAAGYRESARTFILWEGVSNYLTEAAVDKGKVGERLTFSIEPSELPEFLGEREPLPGERSWRRGIAEALLQGRGGRDART